MQGVRHSHHSSATGNFSYLTKGVNTIIPVDPSIKIDGIDKLIMKFPTQKAITDHPEDSKNIRIDMKKISH